MESSDTKVVFIYKQLSYWTTFYPERGEMPGNWRSFHTTKIRKNKHEDIELVPFIMMNHQGGLEILLPKYVYVY